MKTRGLVPVLWLLLAGACQSQGEEAQRVRDPDVENRTPHEQEFVTADTAEGYESGAVPAPVTPVQGGESLGGPLMATGQFQGVGQNPIPGSVTLTEVADGTQLSILVNQYTANAQLQVAIVRGTCASPGTVVQGVQPVVQVGQDGVGTLNAQVPVPTRQLLDGQHAVTLSAAGSVVGCAELPAPR